MKARRLQMFSRLAAKIGVSLTDEVRAERVTVRLRSRGERREDQVGATGGQASAGERGGWYADPFDRAAERWWDGCKWTQDVRGEVPVRDAIRLPRTSRDKLDDLQSYNRRWPGSDASRTRPGAGISGQTDAAREGDGPTVDAASVEAPVDLPRRTKNRLNRLAALVGTLIVAPLLAGALLKGYAIGRPPSPPGPHASVVQLTQDEIIFGVALLGVLLGQTYRWLKAGWSPIVFIGITGVLLTAVGLLGVIPLGGSSATAGQFSSGECFDPTGAATSCGSGAALFKLVKCSAMDTIDRGEVATTESDFPGLKRVVNGAAEQDLCLDYSFG